jgi:hypothetical protein
MRGIVAMGGFGALPQRRKADRTDIARTDSDPAVGMRFVVPRLFVRPGGATPDPRRTVSHGAMLSNHGREPEVAEDSANPCLCADSRTQRKRSNPGIDSQICDPQPAIRTTC